MCSIKEEDSMGPLLDSQPKADCRERPQISFEIQLCLAKGIINKQGIKMAWYRQRPRAKWFVLVSSRQAGRKSSS